jgi:hypothetical protein
MRTLFAFCVGIAATLAWQAYGDTARAMIVSSYPQLGWLAPQSAVAQTASNTIAPPAASPDPEALKTISAGLAEVQQKVDDLATSQDQVTRNLNATLQVAKKEILDKIAAPSTQPAATPARKPTPQVAPVH